MSTSQIKLSEVEVKHIADLARIALTIEEVEHFRDQLSQVIDYNMELLSEITVDGVVPTAQTTGLHNQWGEDLPRPSLPVEIALLNAPQEQDDQFAVQKVFD